MTERTMGEAIKRRRIDLRRAVLLTAMLHGAAVPAQLRGQTVPDVDWAGVEAETIEHFQALLRLDTSNPPGNETQAVEYLRAVLEREGIETSVYALDPDRANLVARIPGNGARQPLLLMGHTDVVTVIPERWTHPPFAATRADGYIYGRGAVDDKDNVVASLMTMILLKRLDVPLQRDVIFLAESGEEGTTSVGIEFMVREHWPEIEAEYCLAEGGRVSREEGEVRYASVTTLEKVPRRIQLTATGPSGHGSIPLRGNAITHLSRAIAALDAWDGPIGLNETTLAYFTRLATLLPEEERGPFRDLLSGNMERARDAFERLRTTRPADAALLRASISPTIVEGGNRMNVIPSQATATLDVRMLPDDDHEAVLASIRETIDDPAVRAEFISATHRPPGGTSLDTEAFQILESRLEAHYGAAVLPTMLTGATDVAYLRARGMQCYGVGPLQDEEDRVLGFAAHGDQERILEVELHRFVRFYWDAVTDIAGG